MVNIQNINIYNTRMQKGMEDKLFFLPQLPNTPFLFVDFGCADGTLLKFLLDSYPNSLGMGIDSNTDMLHLAKKNCSSLDYNRVFFYESLNDCLKDISYRFTDTIKILNFSSVFHEIYHYCSQVGRDEILKITFSGVFDKIFIRDMGFLSQNKQTLQEDLNKFYSHVEYKKMIEEFEGCFGSLKEYKNFVHFLMKYKYQENWDRECSENYFFDYYDLIKRMNYYSYDMKQYQLPYFTSLWERELDIKVSGLTHFQLIASIKR